MAWHKTLVGMNSWSIIAKHSGIVSCSFMSSCSQCELCTVAERGSLSSDHLFPPWTSTNSLYSYRVNQVNDGSVQLSSSVRCCTSACASIRSKEDAGPLGNGQGKDRTAVTASVTTKRPPVPAVGQICTTSSARKLISFFVEILQKIWLYLTCGILGKKVRGISAMVGPLAHTAVLLEFSIPVAELRNQRSQCISVQLNY